MNARDWKGAFGPTPESFKQKVSFALKDAKEGKPVKKIKAATVAALALTVILLAAVAYAAAAKWGLLSFLEYRYNLAMPPEAKGAIQTDLPQTGGEEAEVSFKVREALYDGIRLHLIVEARPKAPGKVLLIGPGMNPGDMVSNAGPAYAGDERTFAQAALEEGKRLLEVNIGVSAGGGDIIGAVDTLSEEDGTLVLHLYGPLQTDAQTLTLDCDYFLLPWQDEKTHLRDQMVRGQFTVELPVSVSSQQSQYSGPEAIDGTGVTVDKIVLTKTSAGIYAELTFSISPDATEAEKALARDGLWFEYLGEAGKRIEMGTTAEGSIGGMDLADGTVSDTTFVQTESLNLWELPGSITVRSYDCWEKTRFGQHTFAKDK